MLASFDGSARLILNNRLPVLRLLSVARHRVGLPELPRCQTGDFREKTVNTSKQSHRKHDALGPDSATLETNFRP